ncbi:hypothetical protein HFP15_39970 [Amycolatopsis sp. K13G38]|uniref:Uncharacterized protein n=1 Tax=Amycolatopsis acididurans TaxID=2724524 RepID=A0ABX1JGV8_9PSEU|nr:hypothetical protein [Amycolatopsis acididurans]NKQ59038.1 hypothetical protein [Amycolatopsis acididurans]
MSGRPEQQGSDYDDGYDPDAWKEFTPWRPGDPSTADEAPMSAAGDFFEGRHWTPDTRPGSNAGQQRDERGGGRQRRSWWWTEESTPRRYETGDRVRNQRAAGAGAFSTVQPGTKGEVVSTRRGLLGDDYATVKFENGYTEEVRTENLERRGWLD